MRVRTSNISPAGAWYQEECVYLLVIWCHNRSGHTVMPDYMAAPHFSVSLISLCMALLYLEPSLRSSASRGYLRLAGCFTPAGWLDRAQVAHGYGWAANTHLSCRLLLQH